MKQKELIGIAFIFLMMGCKESNPTLNGSLQVADLLAPAFQLAWKRS